MDNLELYTRSEILKHLRDHEMAVERRKEFLLGIIDKSNNKFLYKIISVLNARVNNLEQKIYQLKTSNFVLIAMIELCISPGIGWVFSKSINFFLSSFISINSLKKKLGVVNTSFSGINNQTAPTRSVNYLDFVTLSRRILEGKNEFPTRAAMRRICIEWLYKGIPGFSNKMIYSSIEELKKFKNNPVNSYDVDVNFSIPDLVFLLKENVSDISLSIKHEIQHVRDFLYGNKPDELFSFNAVENDILILLEGINHNRSEMGIDKRLAEKDLVYSLEKIFFLIYVNFNIGLNKMVEDGSFWTAFGQDFEAMVPRPYFKIEHQIPPNLSKEFIDEMLLIFPNRENPFIFREIKETSSKLSVHMKSEITNPDSYHEILHKLAGYYLKNPNIEKRKYKNYQIKYSLYLRAVDKLIEWVTKERLNSIKTIDVVINEIISTFNTK